ncbi:MAG TPA: hypothetical protein VHF02_04510, partial [Luteimonas sp.]|nr:hypothetical protein [Luteimonas sp.]
PATATALTSIHRENNKKPRDAGLRCEPTSPCRRHQNLLGSEHAEILEDRAQVQPDHRLASLQVQTEAALITSSNLVLARSWT